LLVDDGKLLLVFKREGDKGPEIAITYSDNGREWSPPYSVVRESAEDLYPPLNPEWLKRPNGDIWLVWYSGRRSGDNITKIVYYAVLKKDKTLSDPQIIHSCDGELYSFSEITNMSHRGLAILSSWGNLFSNLKQWKKLDTSMLRYKVGEYVVLCQIKKK
jgi:hypothetical protein